jgi:hypothetical protein
VLIRSNPGTAYRSSAQVLVHIAKGIGSHPALREALDAIEGASPDELFESYLRTYLHSILAQINARTSNRPAAPRKPNKPARNSRTTTT